MSCRGVTEEKTAKSDPIYRNRLVNMLVNRILKHGKTIIGLSNPLFVLRQAICGVTPNITVPIEIVSTQAKAPAIRWLLAASQKCPGQNMVFKLSSELVDVAKGGSDVIRKKEETHRMAEANRAFAHFC